MDFDQLIIFTRLAAMKSFTRTGESLFLSQPTISARIKALEDEMGVVFFDRSRPREVVLTEDGKVFWNYAQQILNNHNELINRFKNDNKNQNGYINIGCSSVPGIYLMPRILGGFTAEYNRVNINMDISDTAGIINDIIDYSYDFGIVGYSDDNARLIFSPFSEDELILVTASGKLKEYGYKKDGLIPLNLLNELKIIFREPGSATRRVFEQCLKEKGFNPGKLQHSLVIDSLEGVKQAVRYDLGVAVMSRCSVQDYLSTGLLDGFCFADIQLKRHFYIVNHKNRVISDASLALINYIHSMCSS